MEKIYSTRHYHYDLPEGCIAQAPLENRSDSKLMIVRRKTGKISHDNFYNIPPFIEEGDLLVATFKGKRILSQIDANPNVEACYIDREMNFCRIAGEASISDDMEKKELIFNNAPMLRQYFSGPQDENLVLLVIDTKTVEAMTPQDQVPTELSLK